MELILRAFITAVVIVTATEISKRSTIAGALLISLPLTSIIFLCWVYWEGRDPSKIISLSNAILWLTIPSLAFFLALSLGLKNNLSFLISLLLGAVVSSMLYLVAVAVYRWLFSAH